MKRRGATRKTLLTECRVYGLVGGLIPTIGPAPADPSRPVSPGAGVAPRSVSDIHCGSSTALATGVVDAQAWGTGSPPIPSARPTPASTGPRTLCSTGDSALVAGNPASASAIFGRSFFGAGIPRA